MNRKIAPQSPPRVRRSLLAGIAMVWAFTASSAAPTNEHYNFQRFTPREGLPAAVVYCAVQDSRGFMWFGTADGVARFDGREFRIFRPNPADPASLANAAVLGIVEDARGDLWIATEGGLDLWHRATERFSHFAHDPTDSASLSDNTTQCLQFTADGSLWVGTRQGGLNRFDPRTGKVERLPVDTNQAAGTSTAWIRCLLLDRAGILWAGTGDGGLVRLDPKTRQQRTYTHDPTDQHSLPHNRVSALVEDRTGSLWIGTDAGLCRFDAEHDRFERLSLDDSTGSASSEVVTSLIVDRDGWLVIGTDGNGLIRYDPGQHRYISHRHSKYPGNSLVSDEVRALFEDRSGDLWIGHFPAGVSHFDRSTAGFQVFSSLPGETNGLSDDQVLSFFEDKNGDLWVGTDNGGVNHWRAANGTWTSYPHRPDIPGSLTAKSAVTVLRDRFGTLWVGTWGGGLNRFDPETGSFHAYLPQPGRVDALSDSHVWQLAEDREGRLWIATIGGGLARYVRETDSFVQYRNDPANPRSLSDNIVSALLLGRDGTLWAGTPRGLARFDPATDNWDRFSLAPTGTANPADHGYWIFDLVESRDGLLWITTEGGGLVHLDPRSGKTENFRTADGIPSDVLRGMLEDDSGMLWIGSNRGLVRFDPVTHQVRVFDESNGLPGSQFNPHARLRLSTGEFLFGTTQGFVRFSPTRLEIDDRPPPVVLTSFEVFNQALAPTPDGVLRQSITETRRLEIPASFSFIAFRFAALSFRSAARTQYRMKLEGFDRDWRNPVSTRATFTNLDPGTYRLRIKAANGDGIWNNEGVALDLVVVPPWWRTWWFKSGTALAVLAAAAAIGWAVSAQRLNEQQRKRELAAERERAEERAQAAEALRVLNQELEARVTERTSALAGAVKELEAFSYSVSHDLRAPLRSIHGFSTVLLDDYREKLDAEGKDSLRRICAASDRMGHLIDALLDLAHVSRRPLERTTVDLSGLATAILQELQQQRPDQRIEFVVTPDLQANADPRLIRTVLENLLGNACKFAGKRPVARVEFGAVDREGTRTYFVRDNGAGFDMNYAQKLFSPFQRFHAPAEFPGSGIGLATVQRIVQRHGGTVTAESRPDEGATFYFTLPAA